MKFALSTGERISDSVSEPNEVTMAIPQGSGLGGLIILVYINDWPRVSEGFFFTVSFADDTCISLTNFNYFILVRMFNEKLCEVSEWLSTICLTTNKDQTVCVNFYTRTIPESDTFMKINNVSLSYSRTVKYLGVILDESLNFEQHFQIKSDKV